VSCGFSREMLALQVEGDLPDAAAAAAARHLGACEECRRFLEELQASQALLKSAQREAIQLSDCTAMRREVMTIINERPGPLGWRLRIERALALGLRPSYAMAAVLLAGIVSVSVLAQIQPATQVRHSPAVLEGADTLLRPAGFRDWTVVGKQVYITQSSYLAYTKTGIFPDGTVFVWEAPPGETKAPHSTSSTLLASVKDSRRFEGGWGFFDFSNSSGESLAKARALPESRGCRTCHRQSPLSMGA
jgi:hypothetical protein